MSKPVVILAGGTGGAKLARGLQSELGDQLVVIGNTGDDIEIYGGYVSPDCDLITYGLAGAIDDRGWGLRDDTFHVMDGLKALGEDIWFNLGDRDLAVCLRRARRLAAGARLTETIDETRRALGVSARVLPMSDEPVRTWVGRAGQWIALQQFLVQHKGTGVIEAVEYRGDRAARATPEVIAALADAQAIIIGPSNPVFSIGPILAVAEIRAAIRTSDAPVVVVSPLVDGKVVKGPTESCLVWAQQPLSADGIVSFYRDLVDGVVSDQPSADIVTLETDVAMADDDARRTLARATLSFGAALASTKVPSKL